jgi:hypothetical protein
MTQEKTRGGMRRRANIFLRGGSFNVLSWFEKKNEAEGTGQRPSLKLWTRKRRKENIWEHGRSLKETKVGSDDCWELDLDRGEERKKWWTLSREIDKNWRTSKREVVGRSEEERRERQRCSLK